MTIIETAFLPTITDTDRAERLTEAGRFWAQRIDANPATAELTYKVTGEGVGSVATSITAGRHSLLIDEPSALAGDDVAASPVELALAALIGCQTVVYRLYAQSLGIRVDDIEVKAEGDLNARGLFGLDKSVRPGFTAVRLAITLIGPETQERYEQLQAAVDAHCPVFDLFSNATQVSVTVVKA